MGSNQLHTLGVVRPGRQVREACLAHILSVERRCTGSLQAGETRRATQSAETVAGAQKDCRPWERQTVTVQKRVRVCWFRQTWPPPAGSVRRSGAGPRATHPLDQSHPRAVAVLLAKEAPAAGSVALNGSGGRPTGSAPGWRVASGSEQVRSRTGPAARRPQAEQTVAASAVPIGSGGWAPDSTMGHHGAPDPG